MRVSYKIHTLARALTGQTERTTDGAETGEGRVLQDCDDAATQCSNNVAR